jgi:hypothetical protein
MTSTVDFDKVQLPHNFYALAFNQFFDKAMDIDRVASLARNVTDVACSANTLYNNKKAIFDNHPVPQCAKRLKRLLYYFDGAIWYYTFYLLPEYVPF